MCDQDGFPEQNFDPGMSRRAFAMLTAGAAFAGTAAQAAEGVVEKDVEVRTGNGVADAALFYPSGKGPWPAVLIWPDIFGLRPVFRAMGRRLAAEGYVVLVPNPFYRSKKAPVFPETANFANPDDRAMLMKEMGSLMAASVEGDARAYLAFLDRQPQTNRRAKAGVQGYCMGGPLSFRTAAAVPNRIGAVGSFHGGGLVTKEPSSPHLLIEKTNARYLIAIAQNDDKSEPETKNVLRTTLAKAGKPAIVDVYRGDHGWCVPGSGPYNQAEAERAWAALLSTYKVSLA